MKFRLWAITFVALLLTIPVGLGAEITQERTTTLLHVDFPSRIASGISGRTDRDTIPINFGFDRFNRNLGAMTSAKVSFVARFHPHFTGSSTPPRIASVSTTMSSTHTLTPPGSSSPLVLNWDYAGTRDFRSIPPVTMVEIDYGAREGDTGFVELPSTALATYQGAGQVSMRLNIDCPTGVFMSNGSITYNFSADYEVSVSLRYEYVPFMITSLAVTGIDQLSIAWNAKPSVTYQIQATPSLNPVGWSAITNVTAVSSNAIAIVPLSGSENFYRIVIP